MDGRCRWMLEVMEAQVLLRSSQEVKTIMSPRLMGRLDEYITHPPTPTPTPTQVSIPSQSVLPAGWGGGHHHQVCA